MTIADALSAKPSGLRRIVPLNWRGDVVLGLLAMVVVWFGSWRVQPWLDEAATANVTGYPTWDIVQLLTGVGSYPDGVDLGLGPYYLAIHQWVRLVGVNTFTLRLPSMVAAGIGTMAMAAVGRTLVGRGGQLLYAVCFALLPRTTAMAIEARPYGLSAMFVCLAVLVVVKIWKQPRWWHWPVLIVTMLAAMLMHMFAALPLAGLVLVAMIVLRDRRSWFIAGAGLAAVALVAPLAVRMIPQMAYVAFGESARAPWPDRFLVESWLASRTSNSAFTTQMNIGPHYVATVTAVCAALMIIAAVLTSRGRNIARWLSAMGVFVFVLVVMLVGEYFDVMSLGARYWTSAAPVFAMILAESLIIMRGRWPYVLVACVIVGCLAIFALQRRTYAKGPGADYALMGQVLRAHAQPGDGFVIDPDGGWVGPYRNAVNMDAGAFADLRDIAVPERLPLLTPWAADAPLVDLASQPDLPDTIWVASNRGPVSPHATQLEALGYRAGISQSGTPLSHVITRWER